ncbi:hypothetical protein [Okeania sp. SIO2B3]|uniref:hypothetical protein n=1 Tax=Okeania sp. SIO2B3 TaxID=2607784 RepID=UPI0013BF4DE7|nr:hypothetical protein [Okeania sp. SIO2B3]NET45926.1 hypothetical protein [Okeania sp. SIO2B3]
MNTKISITLATTIAILTSGLPANAQSNPYKREVKGEQSKGFVNGANWGLICGAACLPLRHPTATILCGAICSGASSIIDSYTNPSPPNTIISPKKNIYQRTGAWEGIPGYSSGGSEKWVESGDGGDMIFTPGGDIYERTGNFDPLSF